ncbi:hypothetical protein [Bosea thiooxidans]
MVDTSDNVSETNMEQIKIILSTLLLCMEFAMKHIASHEGAESAERFKEELLLALKNGDISMALLEENKTFDLVVSKIEALGRPQA